MGAYPPVSESEQEPVWLTHSCRFAGKRVGRACGAQVYLGSCPPVATVQACADCHLTLET
jgi:hypothetical protein